MDGGKALLLVAVLEKYMVLLAEDVDSEIQWEAVDALSKLASKQEIRRALIQSYPEVVYQLLRLMNDDSRTLLDSLSEAFYIIVVEDSEMEGGNLQEMMASAVEKYVALLADDPCPDIQERALKALSKLASTKAIHQMMIQSYPEVVYQLLKLMNGYSTIGLNRLSEAFYSIAVENSDMEDGKSQAMVASAVEKYVALLADDTLPVVREQAVRALTKLASKQAIRTIMKQSYPHLEDRLVTLMNACSSGPFLCSLTAAFQMMVVKIPILGDSKRLKLISGVIRLDTAFLEEGVESELREGAVRALSMLASDRETCKLLQSPTFEKLVDMVREGAHPSTVRYVAYTIQSVVRNCSGHTGQSMLMSRALEKYFALLENRVEPDLKSEATWSLQIFASLRQNRDLIIAYPVALQKLSKLITIDETPPVLRNVASAVERITLWGTDLKDHVGRFFSKALEMYVAVLTVEVEEELQEEAVRALGILAFNEDARRLFYGIPDAIQRLVGQLNVEFIHRPGAFRGLAKAIYRLACSGKDVSVVIMSRRTILSKLVERCTELLGDEFQQPLQVQAAKVLEELSFNPEARNILVNLPETLQRLAELLKADANPLMFVAVMKIVCGLTDVGTNLEVTTAVTFLLEVVRRVVRLLAHVDTMKPSVTEGIVQSLILISWYPVLRKVIWSYPGSQEHLLRLQMKQSTPPSVFSSVAFALKIINLKDSDLEERTSTEYLSSALKNYIALQADGIHLEQSHQHVGTIVLDAITSHQSVSEPVTINVLSVERRLLKLLETQWHAIDLVDPTNYFLLIDDVNVTVEYSTTDNQFNSRLIELRAKALNSCLSLLEGENVPDLKRRESLLAVTNHVVSASDPCQLVSAFPSIMEHLVVAIFQISEETAIRHDMSGDPTELAKFPDLMHCTHVSILALTLLDPSSADQILLSSSGAYEGRGEAKVRMQMYESALLDYDEAFELNPSSTILLRKRAFVRANLADESGALSDLHQAVRICPDCAYCRRDLGILKQIMGNPHEALVDLNMAHDLIDERSFYHMYTILKHRGYVKFLIGDERGARIDGRKAMLSNSVYFPGTCVTFGSLPTRYLEFAMK